MYVNTDKTKIEKTFSNMYITMFKQIKKFNQRHTGKKTTK